MGAITAALIWTAASAHGACGNAALFSRAAFVPVAAPQCAQFLATKMLLNRRHWDRT